MGELPKNSFLDRKFIQIHIFPFYSEISKYSIINFPLLNCLQKLKNYKFFFLEWTKLFSIHLYKYQKIFFSLYFTSYMKLSLSSSVVPLPALDPKGLSSILGADCLLSPLSKAVCSDTAPLPEKPMAYIGVWRLNNKKKNINIWMIKCKYKAPLHTS